jgi:hypothetical protein
MELQTHGVRKDPPTSALLASSAGREPTLAAATRNAVSTHRMSSSSIKRHGGGYANPPGRREHRKDQNRQYSPPQSSQSTLSTPSANFCPPRRRKTRAFSPFLTHQSMTHYRVGSALSVRAVTTWWMHSSAGAQALPDHPARYRPRRAGALAPPLTTCE